MRNTKISEDLVVVDLTPETAKDIAQQYKGSSLTIKNTSLLVEALEALLPWAIDFGMTLDVSSVPCWSKSMARALEALANHLTYIKLGYFETTDGESAEILRRLST